MARAKVFDLSTPAGRALLDSAYQDYMRPNWTMVATAAKFDVSPTTLTNAFREAGLPLKVNRKASPAAVLKEQRTLRCPLDYLAAKHGVTTRAINKWANEHRRSLVDTHRAASQRWWDAFFARYNDPNDAVHALAAPPHGIPIHAIPALYHKRVSPETPVVWMLDSPTPYNEIDLDTFASYMGELTEPDDSYAPQLWLGYQDSCNPVKWIEEQKPTNANEEPTDEKFNDESDLDLDSLMEDLEID